MPRKKVELDDEKETKKKSSKASDTKKKSLKVASKKTTATKKTEEKKPKTLKAKESTAKKAAAKKTAVKKVKEEVKNEAVKRSRKIVKDGENIKPKESEVIFKIKDFLKKIVEMQEEAENDLLEETKKQRKKKEKEEQKDLEKEKTLSYNIEYYDLPYRYNETVVKILAQTPKKLFVYWDISDDDRKRYVDIFGEHFFDETYPVLLVHNNDKNYTFEVPINDFANSWYLDIVDSKSKYTIQLGRKYKDQNSLQYIDYSKAEHANIAIQHDYLPITTSNSLESPNDHILFENMKPYVIYRNVKTLKEFRKDLSNIRFAQIMGKVYNIYDIYKTIYKNEMEDNNVLDLLNPSSMSKGRGGINNPSSHSMPSSHTLFK